MNKDSEGGSSMLTAGMLVADKANAEWPGTVTATEDLLRVWWHSVVVLPVSFVFEDGPAGIFKGSCGEMSGVKVLG